MASSIHITILRDDDRAALLPPVPARYAILARVDIPSRGRSQDTVNAKHPILCKTHITFTR